MERIINRGNTIKLVVMERGLWGFVEGTETAPGASATATARNAYRLRLDKAYSLIALSVDKSLQVHICSTTDPRAAWETLQKQFECVSIAQWYIWSFELLLY